MHFVRRLPLLINLSWGGARAAESLRQGAPPAQARAGKRNAAKSADEGRWLRPGEPIERELSGGQSHFYKITLTSGQYLQVVVSQRGIDAMVALFTLDGKKIREVDNERTIVGSETISEIVNAAGVYKI
ncbi:MAG TPA: hypothetical protein VFY40_07925, partial [Blastocatellia bacterium]|nr:hypothetical protein [Blastocatellia bacterium]